MKKSQINLFGLTRCIVLLIIFSITGFLAAENQLDRGSIYGKLILKDGTKLQGQIRWGKEEGLWHDFFNSTKEDNNYSIYLSGKEMRELKRKNGGRGFGGFIRRLFNGFRPDADFLPTHQFVCRFGEIKQMQMRGRDIVILTFKNGTHYEVEGGSNDIETRINILDQQQGLLSVKWDRIRSIEFKPLMQPLKKRLGLPLYGTVTTQYGDFKGFIQWDHQECLDTDKLDGDCKDGDISIEFAKINAIEKYKRGSLVTLYSGKEIYIYGSNDVNDDNRGIVINDLHIGKIRVRWDQFDRVEFEKETEVNPASFEDFAEPKALTGKVKTKNGDIFAGRIVYDLDENMDFEIISGTWNEIEYNIPIRNIDSIRPFGSCCSKITLKNGKTIELEDERDVNAENDGLLVWEDSKEPAYIPWKKIREIKFY